MTHTMSLNANWMVDYFEKEPDLFEFAPAGQSVPLLSAWRCSDRFDTGWAAWLMHTFYLEPTDDCVSYVLKLISTPGPVTLYVNGRRMGELDGDGGFEFDITDYVALEDNWIAFRVDCAPGEDRRFAGVRITAIPCA
jgi:hypothetical protein